MLKLVKPSKEILSDLIEATTEFKANPAPYNTSAVRHLIDSFPVDATTFFDYVQRKEYGPHTDGKTPKTILCLFDDSCLVGIFAIRHFLNTDKLKNEAGHISYQILPSCRSRGYAKAGLKLILDYCREKLSLESVLVCSREENLASRAVMTHVMREMGGFTRPPYTNENGTTYHSVWIKTEQRQKGQIRPLGIAVIRKGNKVLALKGYDSHKETYFYRLPGGGIHFCETAKDTVVRELKEEIGVDIQVIKPLPAVENIFEYEGNIGHELIFPFECKLPDSLSEQEIFPMIEPQLEKSKMEYVSIDSEIPIFPEGVL